MEDGTNGQRLGYIPDGYTQPFFIRGVRGLYPDVTGRMRPMQRKPRQRFLHKAASFLQSGAIDKLQDVYASLIKRYIIEWDLRRDHRGMVNRENDEILRIQPQLFEVLPDVILGRVPCDTPPEDSTDPEPEGADDPDAFVDSCEAGESIEETLIKN